MSANNKRVVTMLGASIDGKLHHCAICGRAMSKRCKDEGHFSHCEECGRIYSTLKGCQRHRYRDGYNQAQLEIKRRLSGVEVDLVNVDDDSSGKSEGAMEMEDVDEASAEDDWETWEGEEGERKLSQMWANDRKEKGSKKKPRESFAVQPVETEASHKENEPAETPKPKKGKKGKKSAEGDRSSSVGGGKKKPRWSDVSDSKSS